jgi:hypothetical protein
MRFRCLQKRDAISLENPVPLGKVELEFGRTLKLEQIFTYINTINCDFRVPLGKIEGDATVRLTERSVRSQV